MRLPLSLLLLLGLPGAAVAEEQCKFSDPRSLELQLSGIKTVLFEIASNDLRLEAIPGTSGRVSGRACAARPELLRNLTVTQKRVGSKLVVTLEDDARCAFPLAKATPIWTCAAACRIRC